MVRIQELLQAGLEVLLNSLHRLVGAAHRAPQVEAMPQEAPLAYLTPRRLPEELLVCSTSRKFPAVELLVSSILEINAVHLLRQPSLNQGSQWKAPVGSSQQPSQACLVVVVDLVALVPMDTATRFLRG